MKTASMKGDTKRKWRWSSKSAFASSQPSKVLVVDQPINTSHDAAADRFAVNEMSLDAYSIEDGRERSGMAGRMRRHGSKFLSIVGLQRSSGMCFSLGGLLHTKSRQTTEVPSIPRIPRVSEMLPWL